MKPSDRIVIRRAARAISAAAAFVLCLLPAGASAASTLGLEVERDLATVSRSDERVDYTVRVKQIAPGSGSAGSVGDLLFCAGEYPIKEWGPLADRPENAVEWLRNGEIIPGETANIYTATAADEGKAIQCLVKGTNSVAAMTVASLPVVVPGSPPATPPANYIKLPTSGLFAGSRPTLATVGAARRCSPPPNWNISASATTASGSATLTAVATAKGKGALSAGSTTVTGVVTESGAFREGQTVTGTGIPAGTTISTVGAGSIELSAAATAAGTNVSLTAGSQPFAVGQTVVGANIPAGTTITAVSGQTITLSQAATGAGTNVQIWVDGAWSFQWLRNGEEIPGATSTDYTPQNPGADQNTRLQCRVVGTTAGGSAVSLSEAVTIGSLSGPPTNGPANTPSLVVDPVRVSFTLPGGTNTFVYGFFSANALGSTKWSCESQPGAPAEPAHGSCVTGQIVAPGAEYETFVIAAGLGADTADPAVATATAAGAGSPDPATATNVFSFAPLRGFGVDFFESRISSDPEVKREFEGQTDFTQAGGHPTLAVARIHIAKKQGLYREQFSDFEPEAKFSPTEHVNRIVVDTPRGFIGSARAIPQRCPSVEDVLTLPEVCPPASAVGGILGVFGGARASKLERQIYAIEPEDGLPAQFAFTDAVGSLYAFSPHLRADDGYAISLIAAGAPALNLVSVVPTLCGFGLKSVTPVQVVCKSPGEPGANPVPLITSPARCDGSLPTTRIEADSIEHAGRLTSDGFPDLSDPAWKSNQFANPPVTGCDQVPFEPTVQITPTSHQADSPTGMDAEISMPTAGFEDPNGIAQANLDTATVTFPRGMSINPAASSGLGACAPSQIKLGSNDPEECPPSSKVGTVEVSTPVIENKLTGNVYIAKQNDNPFKTTLGLYLTFASPEDGLLIKVAGKVVPDPVTGQLTSVFTESPEAPFSSLKLHFNDGPRAPLINPPRCGKYAISSELSPWSAANPASPTAAEIVANDSTFEVTEGPGGSACPTGGLEPKLSAGLQSKEAGAKSPFVFTLSRGDGSQRFTGLQLSLPPGLTGSLKGIPYCPDSVLAAIPSAEETGRGEIANPSCPAASQVGTASVGAGAGPFPFYTSGRAYLAGPYKGAPISLAVVTPAVAGPFDLGNVVVRNALRIDPRTTEVTVDSDPIPTILHGILLDVRDIRVSTDFTVAPTNCESMSIRGSVRGEDGGTANVSEPFQVDGCQALPFKPGLKLRIFGGTKRAKYQRLKAVVTSRPGQANIARAAVTLPHSMFLAQEHIRTVCTRVQFAAKACPSGSVYGHATAWTPLLDQPLTGPVYLRSSDNKLPDMVAALRGPDSQPIEIELSGRIDSKNGGIRNTFDMVPDAPVSRFVLQLQGGKKSLIVNSRNVCKGKSLATARFTGQNGRQRDFRPRVVNTRCKKQRKGKRGKGHKRGRHVRSQK